MMPDCHRKQNLPLKPLIKWAGGKSRLIAQFLFLFPVKVNFLVEPFFGGGAVFFHLNPTGAIISDKNEELMNFYRVVRDHPVELLADLQRHVNTEEYYYRVRSLDPAQMTSLERASRFLYLNKYGYNGLWRVNSKGIHNVPYGRYKNKKLVHEQDLFLVSARLKKTRILCGDFSLALEETEPGMFVYLDPPYHPLSETARFTSYTSDSFGEEEQRRLARAFQNLDQRGCRVMLSNSDTPFIRELYRGYNIVEVKARRAINCKGEGRGLLTELVIRNYH
ncbi:MAG TPA: DNA adenine methylase [Peptococcaceae bacterium]|nr:DNA adenine methylase [Peptococcaceae bacterium]